MHLWIEQIKPKTLGETFAFHTSEATHIKMKSMHCCMLKVFLIVDYTNFIYGRIVLKIDRLITTLQVKNAS